MCQKILTSIAVYLFILSERSVPFEIMSDLKDTISSSQMAYIRKCIEDYSNNKEKLLCYTCDNIVPTSLPTVALYSMKPVYIMDPGN